MTAYLAKVKEELQHFPSHCLIHIDPKANAHAEFLAKLAMSKDSDLLEIIPVEVIPESSIAERYRVCALKSQPSWMDKIVAYL